MDVQEIVRQAQAELEEEDFRRAVDAEKVLIFQ